jgi:GTP-binding protein
VSAGNPPARRGPGSARGAATGAAAGAATGRDAHVPEIKSRPARSDAGPSPWDVLSATFVIEARSVAQLPEGETREVAFAGRSNVGKSTLLNALAQRRSLARTSATPGCTRGLVVFDLAFRSGARLRVVDLPGYGFAARARDERSSWGAMIEAYLRGDRRALAAVVILVDARRGPEQEERQLVEYLSSVGVPFVFGVTKVDKLSRNEATRALAQIERATGAPVLGLSGERGDGREALLAALLRLAGNPSDGAGNSRMDGSV